MENFQVISQLRKTETKLLYLLELRKMNTSKPKSWSIHASAVAATKLRQSCLTLCDPIYGSPPGSPVPGILQARLLECVTVSISNAWKWKVKVKSLSRVWLFATPWIAAHQVLLSMGFSRLEHWSGLPCPPPYTHLLNSFRHIWHKNKNGFDFSSQFHCKDDKNKHSGLQFSLLYWVTGIWENDNGY